MSILGEMMGGKNQLEKNAGESVELSAAISLKRIADALEKTSIDSIINDKDAMNRMARYLISREVGDTGSVTVSTLSEAESLVEDILLAASNRK